MWRHATGALLLAAAGAVAVPPGAAAERKTEAVRVAPDRVRITLRLEFHGAGLPQRPELAEWLVRWWTEGAERLWNRAPAARIEGRSVPFSFRFLGRVRPGGGPTAGWHQIRVVDPAREWLAHRTTGRSQLKDGYRSWAYLGGRPGTADSACFARLVWPSVVAHELGHLLGLGDEYPTRAPAAERLRQGLARSVAALRAGNRPSLMELSWAPWAGIQPRHLEAVHAAATRYGWWR